MCSGSEVIQHVHVMAMFSCFSNVWEESVKMSLDTISRNIKERKLPPCSSHSLITCNYELLLRQNVSDIIQSLIFIIEMGVGGMGVPWSDSGASVL